MLLSQDPKPRRAQVGSVSGLLEDYIANNAFLVQVDQNAQGHGTLCGQQRRVDLVRLRRILPVALDELT
jgi:hypothetical protein